MKNISVNIMTTANTATTPNTGRRPGKLCSSDIFI